MNPEHKKYILENAGRKSPAEIASELGIRQRSVKKVIMAGRDKGAPERAVAREAAPKAAARPSGKAIVLISAALIMILGFAVYANSLKGEFIFDDHALIAKNAFIRQWPPSPRVFTANLLTFGGAKSHFYRPLQTVTYALDYNFWKLNVVGYHLTSILLHILAALCVYWMVNILFADRALSFLTAAFFVVHPVHTTAVSYISSRAESLYLVFMLAAFIVYIRSVRHDKGPVSYVVMLACYSIALLSKENALILPALILVYHIAFREKIRPGQFLSVTSLAVIYIFMRLTVLGHLISGAAPVSALVQRIPGFFIAIFTYARLLFLPLGLHIEYGAPLFGITDPRAITGFVILAALIFCALKTRRTNKLVFFSLSWFLVSIAPVSNLYPLNAYMSENWLYLPSIGFFIILAGFFRSLYSKDAFRVPAVILAACLLASYSYLTFRQNQTWQSHIKFCERTLRYAPGSSKVSINLGILYYLTGRKEDAASMFKKTIEIDPHSAEAYDSLGSVYYNTDRKEDAITMYRKAAELNPDYAPAFTNLAGALYYDAGKKEEAIGFYKRVIELKPDSAEACYNLAAAYFNMGGAKEGLYYCRKALEIDPNYEVARASLAKIEAAIKEQAPAPEEGGENKQPAP